MEKMTPSVFGGRPRAALFTVSLILGVSSGTGFSQEGKIQLDIPEVVVVGRGVPLVRTRRPIRPVPRNLTPRGVAVSPDAGEMRRPMGPISFDPGPAFVPRLARPADCYGNSFSSGLLIEREGAPARFRIGYLAFLENRLPRAEEHFRAGLKENPDPFSVSFLGYWLGEVLLRRGQRAEARRAWERVAGDPAGFYAGAAAYRLGLMAYRRGEDREARAWMERVLDRFPGHPQAVVADFIAGEISLRRDDLARAAWHFAGARQAAAERGRERLLKLALFREGMTAFHLERYERATESLDAYLKTPGALAHARSVRFALGWSYLQVRLYRKARDAFLESLRADSDETGEVSLGWLLSALALGREDEIQGAWRRLKGIRSDGRSALWGVLAWARRLHRSGRFQASVEVLEDALRGLKGAEAAGKKDLIRRARLLLALSLYNAGGKDQSASEIFRDLSEAPAGVGDVLRTQAAYGLLLARLGAGALEGAVSAADSFEKRFPTDPRLAEARFWRGEALLRLKRPADARGAFEKIPPHHRLGPEAALGWAYAFYDEGRWPDALAAFGEAAKRLRGRPALLAEVRVRQAEAHYNMRNYARAGEMYRKTLKEFPDGRMAKTAALRLGEMQFRRANYQEAENTFAEYLRRWPKSPRGDEAYFWRGLTRIRLGWFPLARVSLSRLVRDYPKSRYRTMALLQIGHSYYNQGNFMESMAAYNRVLAQNPSSEEAREARYGIVLTQLRSGDTDKFIRDARAFIRKEPDHKLVTTMEFQVAEIYLAQKRYKDALAAYVRVLRRGGPDSDVVHFRIGEIKRLEGKPAEAADYFRDLLDRFPDSRVRGDARYRLAASLAELGDCEGAVREYGLFVRNHPRHSLLTQARYEAANCALRLNDQDAAERYFSQVVQSGGAGALVAGSHYALGRIARKNRRFGQALSHLEAAMKGDVGRELRPRIQFELGSLREAGKQYPRAVVEYLKIIYLYPREKALVHQALLRVAGIYELQDKKAQAIDLYRKVLKGSPEPSVRRRARARLELLKGVSEEMRSQPAEKVR